MKLRFIKMPTKSKEKAKKLTQEEFEKKVLELEGTGLTSEKIGEALRKENIHPKEYKKKISQILGDKYIIPDIKNIEAKLEKIKKHSEKNKKDKRAKREKVRFAALLRRAKKYFKQI